MTKIISIGLSVIGALTIFSGDITHGLLLMILAELFEIPKIK